MKLVKVLIPPKVVLRSLESMLRLKLAMKSSNYYQFSSATDTVRGIKSET